MAMTIETLVARVAELEKQMEMVMKVIEDKKDVSDQEPKKTKAPKKEKAPKEEKEVKPKKKRGMTGYLLYAKEMRPEVKDELIEGGNESPKPTEVITEVAKRWKALGDEEREEWNNRAKTEKEDQDSSED